ncbi:MAG: hypothetical protein P4M08_12165 [Oligoflexia bacterium]|nr:hypothetical protein [Oligoflexia bacterium]
MKSLVVALALISPVLSQAETVVYKGEFDHRPITLRLEVRLPGAIHTTPGGAYQDPEMGTVDVPTTYESEIGTITVSYRGETTTLANDLVGEALENGAQFSCVTSFSAHTDSSGQVTEGLTLDGLTSHVAWEAVLNKAHNKIVGIDFPAEATIHAIYYQNNTAVAGEDVRFVKQ